MSKKGFIEDIVVTCIPYPYMSGKYKVISYANITIIILLQKVNLPCVSC